MHYCGNSVDCSWHIHGVWSVNDNLSHSSELEAGRLYSSRRLQRPYWNLATGKKLNAISLWQIFLFFITLRLGLQVSFGPVTFSPSSANCLKGRLADVKILLNCSSFCNHADRQYILLVYTDRKRRWCRDSISSLLYILYNSGYWQLCWVCRTVRHNVQDEEYLVNPNVQCESVQKGCHVNAGWIREIAGE